MSSQPNDQALTLGGRAALRVRENGFALLPAVFTTHEVDAMRTPLAAPLEAQAADSAIRSDQGAVVAGRNVRALWPAAATLWRRGALYETLTALLGPRVGVVRALYFDKPPDRTWALPWHKDLTIVVHHNRLPSAAFVRLKPASACG